MPCFHNWIPFICRWGFRRWGLQGSTRSRPHSPPSALWQGALRWATRRQEDVRASPSGAIATEAAASGPGVHQTAARQNRVHVRAAGGSGEQVPRNSLPVRVRETEPGSVSESDRNAGEDLVPKQEDQVEKAEPRGGEHLAARLQLPGQPEPGNLWLWVRQLPSKFLQLQLRERDLPYGGWSSTFVHWRAPSSFHALWIRPAELF